MPRNPWIVALLPAAALAACSGPDNTQVSGGGSGCAGYCKSSTTGRPRLGSSSGGSGGSSSSSSGGSTGAGTTGAASTSGTSGGSATGGVGPGNLLACQSVNPANCPQYLCAQVYDYSSEQPVAPDAGIVIGAVDANGLPVSLSGQLSLLADSSFLACGPAGIPFVLTASGTNYDTTYSAQLVLPDGGGLSPYFGFFGQQFPAFATTEYNLFASFVKLRPNTSIIAAAAASYGSDCSDPSGLVFSLQLPDGGAIPQGGDGGYDVDYVVGGLPDISGQTTATTNGGNAFLFNIDPSLGAVVVVATPTAGAPCRDAGAPVYGALDMTGLVQVGPGPSFSVTAVPLP